MKQTLYNHETKQDLYTYIIQRSSVTQSCLTLCDPMDCSMPGFTVHHQLPELAQTHVRWVSNALQPSCPLSSPSPLAFNLSQHQSLFQWGSSSHQVAKVLELQFQHRSFQWMFRTDSKKAAICKLRSRPSQDAEAAGTLTLDFPASRTMRKECLWFQLPILWYLL